MRICYPFCHPKGGGTEWHALYLAREAVKSGHEVSFIFSEDGRMVDAAKKEGFEYSYISMGSSFDPIRVLRSAFELKKYFIDHRVDLVHAHMLREQSLVILAKFLGSKVKLIRTFHRTDQFNWKMKPLMWLYNWQTDCYIAISNYMLGYLAQNGIRKNIELVYNGVTRMKVVQHAPSLGFMGRVVPEKGIYEFVKKNKDLFGQDQKLLIGGDGEDLPLLQSYVKANHTKGVEILGRVEDQKDFFSKISIFVLPASHEVLPLVALEAFSSGIPVVAFDLPVLEELIDGNNGILVKQGDYATLASEALRILKSKDLPKYQTAASHCYEANYTIEQMWKKTEAVYKKYVKTADKVLR